MSPKLMSCHILHGPVYVFDNGPQSPIKFVSLNTVSRVIESQSRMSPITSSLDAVHIVPLSLSSKASSIFPSTVFRYKGKALSISEL